MKIIKEKSISLLWSFLKIFKSNGKNSLLNFHITYNKYSSLFRIQPKDSISSKVLVVLWSFHSAALLFLAI